MITFIIIIHWATAIGDVQTRVFFTGFWLCLPCILAHGECGVLHDVLNATCMYVEYEWYMVSQQCVLLCDCDQYISTDETSPKMGGCDRCTSWNYKQDRDLVKKPPPPPLINTPKIMGNPNKELWPDMLDLCAKVILYKFRCIRLANSHPYWDSCNSTTKIGALERAMPEIFVPFFTSFLYSILRQKLPHPRS